MSHEDAVTTTALQPVEFYFYGPCLSYYFSKNKCHHLCTIQYEISKNTNKYKISIIQFLFYGGIDTKSKQIFTNILTIALVFM
jgi:hypothetical protein